METVTNLVMVLCGLQSPGSRRPTVSASSPPPPPANDEPKPKPKRVRPKRAAPAKKPTSPVEIDEMANAVERMVVDTPKQRRIEDPNEQRAATMAIMENAYYMPQPQAEWAVRDGF